MPSGLKFRLLPMLIGAGALVIMLRSADVASRLIDGAGLEPVHAAHAEPQKPSSAASGSSDAKEKQPSEQTSDSHATPDASLSPAEMDLLQSLQKRREELDQRDATIQQHEATLKAAEGRVDQKLAELTELKASLEKLLDLQKEKQSAEMTSLVKIYSTMKPADAARIFNTLEMPVLLSVVSHMKERNSASIIAAMRPEKARELTDRLADLRQLPTGAAADSGPAGIPTALTPTAAQAAAQGAATTPAPAQQKPATKPAG